MDASTSVWEPHMNLVLEALNEQQRHLVAGLMSEVIGRGGIARISELSGLDHKTISRGRKDLQNRLEGCPQERVRAKGAGRPQVPKKIHYRVRSA